MPRTISFGQAAPAQAQAPLVDSQRYVRQQAMSEALLGQGSQRPQNWGDAIGKLAQQAAGVFAGNRAKEGEQAATNARLEAMRAAIGSGDPLAALGQSNDPQLVEMGLQAQMAKLLKGEGDLELKEVWDPQANGGKGGMVYLPEQQAIGMQAQGPAELKAAPQRTIRRNGLMVDQELTPTGWVDVGQGAQFADPAPREEKTPDIITLTGPDGKALSVFANDPRLPDLINNQGYVEGKPAIAPAGKPGDLPESLKFYTERAKPYIDAATETRRQGATIETALKQGNGTGDIAAITSFNKLLDPGAVVREADVSLTLAAQGLADQLAVWMKNKQEGDILPAPLREKIGIMAKQIVDTNLAYSKERIMGFRQGAEKYGVDWTDILPPNVESQLFPVAPPPSPASGGASPDDRGGMAASPYVNKYGLTPRAP